MGRDYVFRFCFFLFSISQYAFASDINSLHVDFDSIEYCCINGNRIPYEKFNLSYEGGGSLPSIYYDQNSRSNVLRSFVTKSPRNNSKDRSEITIRPLSFGHKWSIKFKINFVSNSNPAPQWHLVMQCHQHGSSPRPPILSLNIVNNSRVALVARSDSKRYRQLYDYEYELGRWYSNEIRVNFQEYGNVVWLVDNETIGEAPASFGYNDAQPICNLKFGTYSSASASSREILFDDIKVELLSY